MVVAFFQLGTLDVVFQQLLNGIMAGGVYALCAAGMALIFGVMRLPNFAHGQIYMLAAFTAYSLYAFAGLGALTATILTCIAFIGVGILTRKTIFFDLRTMNPTDGIILSMGLATLLEGLALMTWGPNYKQVPPIVFGSISLGQFIITYDRLLVVFVSVVTLAVLWAVVFKTKLGRAMRAIQQNRDAAETLGTNVERTYTLTFAIGILVTCIASAFVVPIFSVDPYVGRPITIKSFAIVVFGGMGSLKGAVLCGLILGIIESLGVLIIPAKYIDLISYGIMILVILLKPTGLFGRY